MEPEPSKDEDFSRDIGKELTKAMQEYINRPKVQVLALPNNWFDRLSDLNQIRLMWRTVRAELQQLGPNDNQNRVNLSTLCAERLIEQCEKLLKDPKATEKEKVEIGVCKGEMEDELGNLKKRLY